jgi:hypothetical protein
MTLFRPTVSSEPLNFSWSGVSGSCLGAGVGVFFSTVPGGNALLIIDDEEGLVLVIPGGEEGLALVIPGFEEEEELALVIPSFEEEVA